MDSTPEITKKRLLLADDSVTIRKVVELTFAEEGIEVVAVADGDAAMDKFIEQTPDIVLLDVEMPGANGYQLCEMIKGDESSCHIPVILLVGSFEPFDHAEAERVEANGFLTKPFHSIRELVNRVNELLGEAGNVATSDTADIEDLYNSSFAETIAADDDVEVSSEHGELADDDFIEQSYAATGDEDPLASFDDLPAENDEISAETLESEVGEGNNGDMSSRTPIVEEEGLGEPTFDDEMVEAVSASGSNESNGHNEINPMMENGVPFDAHTSARPARVDHSASLLDAQAETVEMSPPSAAPPHLSPQIPSSMASCDQMSAAGTAITDELITKIAKRVVEKLSDRVIREIAQDAVPRIAEKLIREALDEERGS